MSFIPWDDELVADDQPAQPPTRPAFLPSPGEPCDLATATRIMDWYGPEIRTALDRSAQDVRQRHHEAAITVQVWTPDDVVQFWGADTGGVLIAYIMVDDQGHSQRFRSVLTSIDKASGDLAVQDESGLLST